LKNRFSKCCCAVSYVGGRRAAEAAVDLDDRLLRALDLVDQQGVAEERANEQVVDEQDVQLGDAGREHLGDRLLGELLVALDEDAPGVAMSTMS
jgi:hypothetical protein